jgi:outer membrane autotransporter protein
MTYGDMLNDGLHQRLGDIRQATATATASGSVRGEVFARYIGGQYRYTSNQSFQNFGFEFDQQVNALQLGGSVLALSSDASTFRAGWALDRGTTHVTPHAVDGDSQSKYTATGVSAWMTWQLDSGFYVDGVIGGRAYRGDVSTSLRGSDVARVRATGRQISIEAGYPLALGTSWTLEPQVQVQRQTLTFDDFRDADDLDIRLGKATQTTTRVGAMLTRTANVRFMPYARIDLSHAGNGKSNADVSSEAFDIASRFNSGRVGNAWHGSLGAASQLTPHVQIFGEGNYQHFVGTFGMRGWSANAGVRVTF